MKVVVNLPPCLIGMEAYGSAHYWTWEFRKHQHVKLMGKSPLMGATRFPFIEAT